MTTTEPPQSDLIDERTDQRSMGKLTANSRQSDADWVKHEEILLLRKINDKLGFFVFLAFAGMAIGFMGIGLIGIGLIGIGFIGIGFMGIGVLRLF